MADLTPDGLVGLWRRAAATMPNNELGSSIQQTLEMCADHLEDSLARRVLDSTVPASDGGATNPEAVEGLRLWDVYASKVATPGVRRISELFAFLEWAVKHLRPILAAAAGEQVEP